MIKAADRLSIVEELLDIVAYQVVRRLKGKKADITEREIEEELRNWYRKSPPGPGVPVDIKKYFND